LDHTTKSSNLDNILLQAAALVPDQLIYKSFINDSSTALTSLNLPLLSLLQAEYQDVLSTTLLVSPELVIMLY
jgi:hypothetical protein